MHLFNPQARNLRGETQTPKWLFFIFFQFSKWWTALTVSQSTSTSCHCFTIKVLTVNKNRWPGWLAQLHATRPHGDPRNLVLLTIFYFHLAPWARRCSRSAGSGDFMGVWCSLAVKCQQANEKRYLKVLSSIFNQALGCICCLIRREKSASWSLWLLWKYLGKKLIFLFKLCALSADIPSLWQGFIYWSAHFCITITIMLT